MSLPAVSMAARSDASEKRRGGWVSFWIDSTASVSTALALLERRQGLVAAGVVLLRVRGPRLVAVDRLPAGLDEDAAARPEDVVGDRRLDARSLVDGLGVEDGEEAPGDEVVDLPLVVRKLLEVVLGLGRDDRVVVGDLLVVDHAAERQLVEPGDVGGGLRVLAVSADEGRGRLDLADHVARQEARARAGVRDRLLVLVELLRGREGAARREAEEVVRPPLERGQVVEKLRALALLLLLELRDLAGLAASLVDDLRRVLLGDPLAAQVAAAVEPVLVGGEARLDEPVGLGDEGADLHLAPRDEREGRRLDAAERDGAVEGGAEADRGGARRVHPDEPVGLVSGARRGLEEVHLLAGPKLAEGVLDRLLRHRVQPEPLDGLVGLRGLVEVGEDELALAAGVAGVHDPLDLVVLDELVHGRELLLGLVVVRHELELLRDDRQVGVAPLLELGVVRVRLGQADEVSDGPRDDVLVSEERRLVRRLLERARQDGREVAADGGLLCDYECFRHLRDTVANGKNGASGRERRAPSHLSADRVGESTRCLPASTDFASRASNTCLPRADS